MKHIKRTIYKMLAGHFRSRVGSFVDSFEMAYLEGDHRGMEYCDRHIAKYLEKEKKYVKKLEAL